MKLRHYETMLLLHPELNSEQREELIQKYSQIITDDGGQMVFVDPWPLKKLAYRVQKLTKGYYVVMEYGAPGSTIHELTRLFRLDEGVMKFMTTKLEDEFTEEMAAKRREELEKKSQEKKKAEEARQAAAEKAAAEKAAAEKAAEEKAAQKAAEEQAKKAEAQEAAAQEAAKEETAGEQAEEPGKEE